MKKLAIIPARKWSKWIKNKNIKLLNKKPLIYYSIEAAIKSQIFDKICIATDYNKEIINKILSNSFNDTYSNIDIISLPDYLTKDDSKMIDVVLYVLNFYKNNNFDLFTLLQPTSPLRTYKHILEAMQIFEDNKKFNSLVSFSYSKKHPYKSFVLKDNWINPLFWTDNISLPRQLLPKIIAQNWAIYISKIDFFKKEKTFFSEPTYPYIMDEISSLDIDSELDFYLTEYIIKNV